MVRYKYPYGSVTTPIVCFARGSWWQRPQIAPLLRALTRLAELDFPIAQAMGWAWLTRIVWLGICIIRRDQLCFAYLGLARRSWAPSVLTEPYMMD
jgi:hypothetical protein